MAQFTDANKRLSASMCLGTNNKLKVIYDVNQNIDIYDKLHPEFYKFQSKYQYWVSTTSSRIN